jgi:hypothetical protein
LITALVLGLLLVCIVRFNKRANPTPARWSHNTTVEILWTVVPVLILMFIAIFSFRLLFEDHDMPKPDLTVKVDRLSVVLGLRISRTRRSTNTPRPDERDRRQGQAGTCPTSWRPPRRWWCRSTRPCACW